MSSRQIHPGTTQAKDRSDDPANRQYHRARHSGDSTQDHVHFHAGSDGRPYVCDYQRCDSPGLTRGEVSLPRA